jgi:hypothetical protein
MKAHRVNVHLHSEHTVTEKQHYFNANDGNMVLLAKIGLSGISSVGMPFSTILAWNVRIKSL